MSCKIYEREFTLPDRESRVPFRTLQNGSKSLCENAASLTNVLKRVECRIPRSCGLRDRLARGPFEAAELVRH